MTTTDRDIRDQVQRAVDASEGTYDVDAIIRDIVQRYGLVDVDTIDHDEFRALVAEHVIDGTITIDTQVRNPSGSWETIETETAKAPFGLANAEISATDIGGEPGQPIRIETRDSTGAVLDSIEIVST